MKAVCQHSNASNVDVVSLEFGLVDTASCQVGHHITVKEVACGEKK